MNNSINNESSLSSKFFDEIKPNLKVYDENSVKNYLKCSFVSEKLERDLLELIEKTPQEIIGEKWQNYVIFKDSKVAVTMKYSPDQERYGNWMHHTVRIAASGFMEKEWSFNEILEFLCFARYYIGSDNSYGASRKRSMETAFFGNSPYVAINEFYKSYLPDGATCKEKKVSATTTKFIHIGYINQEKIKLSKIFIGDRPVKLMGQSLYGSMVHTNVKKIDKIMNFVETKLYPEASDEKDEQELIKKLGRIFWWICQAKPWRLGDPSIAEMLIRTIWASKGFPPPAWKEGIVPWVEVSNEPDVERFAENFHTLFK